MSFILRFFTGLSLKEILVILGVLALLGSLLFAYGKGYEAAKYKADSIRLHQVEVAIKTDIERRDAVAAENQKTADQALADEQAYKDQVNELLNQIDARQQHTPVQPGPPDVTLPPQLPRDCLDPSVVDGLRKLW